VLALLQSNVARNADDHRELGAVEVKPLKWGEEGALQALGLEQQPDLVFGTGIM
jgi:hypothetical protein